jgi:hypothetical protein
MASSPSALCRQLPLCQSAAVDEVTARKRRFISTIVIGGGVFAAVSVVLATRGLPGPSGSGMALIWAFFAFLGLGLLGYVVRLFVRVPARVRVTRPVAFRVIARLSCMAGQLTLLALALASLPFGHGAARLLFHGLIVSLFLSALVFLGSDAAMNFALLSKRFRASITPAE